MTSNNPEQPRRPIEIVPLLPRETSSASGFTRSRGAWREPLVHSSVHETAPFASRPDPSERVWVVAPALGPRVPAATLQDRQNRLHAILDQERTALLAQIDAGTTDQPTSAQPETAPFPLPAMSLPAMSRRRTPKPRRADASGRPLAANVAAAIARATGHEQPPTPAPNLSLVRRRTARERLDIVSLDKSAELVVEVTTTDTLDTTVEVEAPVTIPPKRESKPVIASLIDLRERRRLRDRAPLAYMCPTCDRKGIVDRIDNVAGMVSATCPRCLETWTAEIHPDHLSIEPR